MFIHNTTFVVERSVSGAFEEWARSIYVKAARESGRFATVTMAKILTEVSPETVNYAIQMMSPTLEGARDWQRDVAALLHDDIAARLGADRVLFFATEMEVLE